MAHTFPVGRANKKVKLQKPTRVADGRGGQTVTWTDVATVYAQISPSSGRERYFADQIQREATHKMKIRYRSDVHAGWRAVHNNRIFEITGVIDVAESHVTTELSCKEQEPAR